VFLRWVTAFFAITTVLPIQALAQTDDRLPRVCEGELLYRSPLSGGFVIVPLLHTDVALDVRGLAASATVAQQYVNSNDEPIEAVYVFPLPHDAAVYDLEIRIGNRLIHSVIRERGEAKRVYEAAKSEGQRAALVEEERPNIFTASVANLMPGDRVDVRLRYVEPLHWEEGKIRLTFPMVVGPRYIPVTEAAGHDGRGWVMDTDAVPDASRITPPVRISETRAGHDISVAVDLDAGFEFGAIRSIAHQINIKRPPDGRQHVELAGGATIPNKDFILEVQQAESTQPKTALFLSPERAAPGQSAGETHFLLAAFPPSMQPARRVPVEMLYMIDISGSMAGTSIEQARGALLDALDRLHPDDRFAIVAFNHSYFEFSTETLVANADNVGAGRQFVERLEAGGGTEMLPALLHLMSKPETPNYLRHIVLLTDGDLGNEEQIFAAMRQNLAGARLYTVAIGSSPNFFLATKMAQFGRGTFTHIANLNEIGDQMGRLLEMIESPVLTDVKLSFEGVEVADVYPERPQDLFLRQPLLAYGRITKGTQGKLHITARAGSEPYDVSIPFDASRMTFHPAITTLWARQRVEELMDRWRESDADSRAGLRAALIAQAIRYRLVTRFTSLVAVEDVVANASGSLGTVDVPTEFPEGSQPEKIFGAPATGTADAFLEALGLALLYVGVVFWLVLGVRRAGVAS
jgi:Ca-activated chloride channel family protein